MLKLDLAAGEFCVCVNLRCQENFYDRKTLERNLGGNRTLAVPDSSRSMQKKSCIKDEISEESC